MKVEYPKPGKYVVAVSGGRDSMVLLDVLHQQDGLELVVAHFDHGTRPDSAKDGELVGQIAASLGRTFVAGEGKLGAKAGETAARRARYEFLERVRAEQGAQAVITAHHRDDVIETMILNLLRGTGWRGLCSLRSAAPLLRPLLAVPQAELAAYAERRQVPFRDDPTNTGRRFRRNRIRHELLPAMRGRDPQAEAKLYELYEQQRALRDEIEPLLARLTAAPLERGRFIMLPNELGLEVLRELVPVEPSRQLLKRALVFAKTARPRARFQLGGGRELMVTKHEIRLSDNAATADAVQ